MPREFQPITKAQFVRPYVGPQWLVEPVGDESDAEDVAAINAGQIVTFAGRIAGWGPYTRIIRIGEAHYLADGQDADYPTDGRASRPLMGFGHSSGTESPVSSTGASLR